jgi:hypothetical protein
MIMVLQWLAVSADISQERSDDFYEDYEEGHLQDEDALTPSASALVSKDDFRQRRSPILFLFSLAAIYVHLKAYSLHTYKL